ncbi:hypothetical protein [Paenibacillus tarimensis]|uniref:hypothetical protein n=1 Tax=Paenibacillus tarimensis TaxID=416012 RepID=UPI001F2E0D0A|nr:hypothetical protein [Paenibacillus tarimensis]MCF2945065.1 hypothetical protein [Paenibacillus tarimensis]
MLKKTIALGVVALAVLGSSAAYAYNYKFKFDMNTGLWHGAAYSSEAYKFTTDESPVVKVSTVESKVRMNFLVVNSEDEQRTDVFTTKTSGTHLFENYGMAINKKYRLKAYTDDGSWYNTYNVTGAWNPDSY